MISVSLAVPDRIMESRIKSGKWRITELGVESRCTGCHTYWPADAEFYYAARGTVDGLASVCKACHAEYRKKRS